jgi:hypothetical protein
VRWKCLKSILKNNKATYKTASNPFHINYSQNNIQKKFNTKVVPPSSLQKMQYRKLNNIWKTTKNSTVSVSMVTHLFNFFFLLLTENFSRLLEVRGGCGGGSARGSWFGSGHGMGV